jgi:hypothetical protein
MGESVKYAAISFSKSAGAMSKPAKKWRQPIASTIEQTKKNKKGKAFKRNGFLFEIYRQKPKQNLIVEGSKKRDPKVALITNRGLAKRSWGWMLAKMGSPRGPAPQTEKGGISGKKFVRVTSRLKSMNPQIRLINTLSYLQSAYRGLVTVSLNKATKSLLFHARRGVNRSIKRK